MSSQIIVIIGFMGAGKTSVGNELARALDCRAVDLDSWIIDQEQRAPGEIIEKDGEEAFRRIETRALGEVLQQAGNSAIVIAVGGGAWMLAENRELIAKHEAFTVWLDAPFELCWGRIASGDEARPLAPSREIAQALYDARRPVYALAEARIAVSETENAKAVARKVVDAMSQSKSTA
jgi:shikimate kinase